MLALGRVVVVAICAAVVIVTVVVWRSTAPPVIASATLPPVMRRGVYWWLGGTLFFAFAACAWLALRTPMGLPRHGAYRYVALGLGLVPLVVINPVYLWRTAWVRRSLAAARGRLCTHCAYDVSGLEAAGTCPECGRAYDAEADARVWEGVQNWGDGAKVAGDEVGAGERSAGT